MDINFTASVNNCDIYAPIEFTATIGRGQYGSVVCDIDIDVAASGSSNYGYAIMPKIAAFGGEDLEGYGCGLAYVPAIVAQGEGGGYVPPEAVYGFGFIPKFVSFGISTQIVLGDGDANLPKLISKGGDTNFGEGYGTLQPMYSWGDEGPSKFFADAHTYLYLFEGAAAVVDFIFIFNTNMQLTDTISGTRAQIASILTSLSLSPTIAVYGSFSASMLENLTATTAGIAAVGTTTFPPVLDEDSRVWVVNMDTSASGQYDDYGFNSFFQDADGYYYGVAEDGIYRLEGDTDAGQTINWEIDFGISNCGIKARKKVPNVYVGVTTGGTTYLKVNVDGTDYTYQVERCTRGPYDFRAKIPHDIQGHQWGFTLMSADDTDLIGVEFVPANLTRRI